MKGFVGRPVNRVGIEPSTSLTIVERIQGVDQKENCYDITPARHLEQEAHQLAKRRAAKIRPKAVGGGIFELR